MGSAAATDTLTFDALAGLLAGGEELDAPTVAAVLNREQRTWSELRRRCDELAAAASAADETDVRPVAPGCTPGADDGRG